MGLRCLSFRTFVCPIQGRSKTGIGVFSPGRPATTSIGYSSEGIFRNIPRSPPSQRTPRSLRPVGHRDSLSGRCPRLGPPWWQGPYPISGSEPPTGLVGGLGLMVIGMPWWAVFAGCRQLDSISPHSARGSALTWQSLPLAVIAIRFRPTPSSPPHLQWLLPWIRWSNTQAVATVQSVQDIRLC